MSGEPTAGPWVKDGRTCWWLHAASPDGPWQVEYRRAEPGASAGYWLFGDGFEDGKRLAGLATDARYEAFGRVWALLLDRGRSPAFRIVWGADR